MDEEQQAAAKAAAKKAKKLRQKLNKQHLQQEQLAAAESSLQHSPSADADADNNGSEGMHKTSLVQTENLADLVSGPSSHDYQRVHSSYGRDPPAEPSQAADLVAAINCVGFTARAAATTAGAAGSAAGTATNAIAGNTLLSAAVSSSTEQGAGQQPLTSQPLPNSTASSQAVDDDIFLQDLFTCPLTKVSRHCNTVTRCHTTRVTHKNKYAAGFHCSVQTCCSW